MTSPPVLHVDGARERAASGRAQGEASEAPGTPRGTPTCTIGDPKAVRLAKFDKKEIFSASGGQPTPLTPDAIQTLFKRLTRETGIHVNPHKVHHTFATRPDLS